MTLEQLEQVLARENEHQSALDRLSDRELEVFSLMSQGSSSAYICREMAITPQQLATYKQRILTKFELKTEQDLAQIARLQGQASRVTSY
jgi:DNA-binding CsgD family transcriptional regulator